MYAICVRDHVMIAHSFRGELFGPAQKMHGATYVIDVEFRRPTLDVNGVVVDIGRAGTALRQILAAFEYSNLDEHPQFRGVNTTTEYLARHVFDRVSDAVRSGTLGPGSEGIVSMKVVLHESHVAWASYEGSLRDGASS